MTQLKLIDTVSDKTDSDFLAPTMIQSEANKITQPIFDTNKPEVVFKRSYLSAEALPDIFTKVKEESGGFKQSISAEAVLAHF